MPQNLTAQAQNFWISMKKGFIHWASVVRGLALGITSSIHSFIHSFMCYYDLLWFIIRVLSRLSRCPNLRISFSNSSHIELKGRFLIHYFLWLFSNICKIYLGDVSSTLSILRNRRRAGNKYRSWKIWQKFEVFCNEKTGENYFSDFWYYI